MIDIQGTPVQIDSGCVQMGAYPFVYEDMYEPRLARLREEEALDSVVADAKDDVDAMAKLRHYVRTLWPHTHPDPPPPADALEMLHLIRKGKTGGFCGNFTTVFTQCCAALGLHARRVGVQWEDGGGHSVTEVWSDALCRWVLMDVDFDNHYVRNGLPLNALELHQAWIARETEDIEKVEGGECPYPSDIVGMYYFFSVEMANHFMTRHRPGAPRPEVPSVAWADAHTPPRGRVHTERAEDLYWTLNQTEMTPEPTDRAGCIRLRLKTFTPGFRDFQVRVNGGAWESLGPTHRQGDMAYGRFDWGVEAGSVAVWARNVLGVCGRPAVGKGKGRGGA